MPPDPIETLRAQGLNDIQIRQLAESGQAPAYLKNIMVAQGQAQDIANQQAAIQANQQATAQQAKIDEMRAAQGEYEKAQQLASDFGLPANFGQETVPETVPNVPNVGTETQNVDPATLTGVPETVPNVPQTDRDLANQYLQSRASGGLDRVLQAINEEKALAKDLGERQAQLQEAYNAESIKLQEKQDQIEAKRQVEAEKLQADIDSDIKAIGDQKIDPDRFWSSRTTGQKILAGLSLALSGFAQGYSGAPNTALTILNKAMNDDILAQKSEFQSKREALAGKRTAYAQLMGKYNNEIAAVAGAKAAALERMQGEIKAIAARKSGSEAAINAEKMIGQLQMQKEAENQKVMLELMKQQNKRSDELSEYVVPGYGLAYGKKEAEELRTQVGDLNFTTNTIDGMIDKIDQFGISDAITPSQLKKDLQAASKFLRARSRLLLLGPGTVTEEEYQRLVDAIPTGDDLTEISRTGAKRTLKSVKKIMTDILDYQLKSKIKGYKGRIGSELGTSAKKVE